MDEIVIKVEGEETPPETPPVVVVAPAGEPAPAGDALGAALAVMTLETLAADVATLKAENESLRSLVDYIGAEMGKIRTAQIVAEVEEIVEESPGELVREEIPAVAVVAETTPPEERKKSRFI